MSALPTVLETIVKRKQEEVAQGRQQHSEQDFIQQIARRSEYRGFKHALVNQMALGNPAVIAEVKKASPSKGVIREHFVPDEIAHAYAMSGAACLSVLTDVDFFQGHSDYLTLARNATTLPVLRKDFIVDPWQVYETAAMEADCLLLIVACLSDEQLKNLYDLARNLGLDVLVEVHDEAEFERALQLGEDAILGVNNRNLHTFEVSLNTTFALLDKLPEGRFLVTESGIATRNDVSKMRDAGIHAFLVGEAFMREPDPGQALGELFQLGV